MGKINLDGRAYRGLAGGRIPWWVLITGWFIFGTVVFIVLIPAIASLMSDFPSALITLIPALLIGSIPLVILWRGTTAKLSEKKKSN